MRKVTPEDLIEKNNAINSVLHINSKRNEKPKAFIETYGCAQNENDSEMIKGMLEKMGYEFCSSYKQADFVLYNTCAVRENAELRVFGNLGALKGEKRERPDLMIAVCGCMMQQAHIRDEIKKKYKHVDIVFGTHALYKFPQLLAKALEGEKVVDAPDEETAICEDMTYVRAGFPVAKIPIMYGCNNFCTYCIVPYVRGRERSRNHENILDEVRQVASEGYKEVMLLGTNVNSYGGDNGEMTFPKLLKEVAKVEGIERIRFMTSHPKDLSDELIEVIATEKKVCNQLHLPVQSGSDRILKLMNRKYTAEKYMEIVEKLKKKVPDISLTTDIIAGFPGETNEDFDETLKLLEKVRFDTIFSFIYSKRKGTPAAEMEDCLTEEEKHKNFDRMIELQNKISREINESYVGKTVEVLVEGESKTNPDILSGRCEQNKIVNFRGEKSLVGKIIKVKITEAKTWSLTGERTE